MMETEGVDNFIKRHRQDAEFLRAEIKKMGLELYSKAPSYAVTGVNMPAGVDGSAFVKALKAKGVTVAGGQDTLKGKIIRIAHMGGIKRADIEFALAQIKKTLEELKK
jgi:aspartate aminotransferase-like enzyme